MSEIEMFQLLVITVAAIAMAATIWGYRHG